MWGLILLGVSFVIQIMVIFMFYALIMMVAFGAAFSIPYIIDHNPELKSITGALSMQPGTGTLTTVKPYPGSQKINTPNGKDNDGSYTMTQYTTSADVATVKKSFESQFKTGGSYTSSSIGTKTYMKATTAIWIGES